MKFPDKRQVEEVRQAYPIGTTVRCVSISDPYTEIPPGTLGEVTGIDDTATVFVKWRTGVTLGAVYNVDRIEKVPSIPEKVMEQLMAVRAEGQVNMLDIHAVRRIAFDKRYYELVDFIESDRRAYARLILTGETS